MLNREFEAEAPNQRWVGDTTELLTPSGKRARRRAARREYAGLATPFYLSARSGYRKVAACRAQHAQRGNDGIR